MRQDLHKLSSKDLRSYCIPVNPYFFVTTKFELKVTVT